MYILRAAEPKKGRKKKTEKRGTPQEGGWGQGERMRLRDPQTQIPLPFLARATKQPGESER